MVKYAHMLIVGVVAVRRTLFVICVINSWITAIMLFVCEVISKTLPVMGEMLFRTFGGGYSQNLFQADFKTLECVCVVALAINIIAVILLGICLFRKENNYEKNH